MRGEEGEMYLGALIEVSRPRRVAVELDGYLRGRGTRGRLKDCDAEWA